MDPLPHNAALIVIDVQQAFDNPVWGKRNNPSAEQRVADLLNAWRRRSMPLIHIQHRNPAPGSLFNPDGPGFPVKPEAQPLLGEPVLYKRVNSSFIGTDLEARLLAQSVDTVVIAGITTDHCCSTTARMAANLDFKTYFVSDATATFDRTSPPATTTPPTRCTTPRSPASTASSPPSSPPTNSSISSQIPRFERHPAQSPNSHPTCRIMTTMSTASAAKTQSDPSAKCCGTCSCPN